jgi:hypothetical protein
MCSECFKVGHMAARRVVAHRCGAGYFNHHTVNCQGRAFQICGFQVLAPLRSQRSTFSSLQTFPFRSTLLVSDEQTQRTITRSRYSNHARRVLPERLRRPTLLRRHPPTQRQDCVRSPHHPEAKLTAIRGAAQRAQSMFTSAQDPRGTN